MNSAVIKMKKRHRGRRAGIFFLALTMVLSMKVPRVYAKEYWPEGPQVQSLSAVVLEVNTGTVLYEKDKDERRYPASITKIMTTLLAVENCSLDEVVTFSADAVYKNEGNTSHIARDFGEEMTLEQCLYAVMLASANECAYAVAEHVGAKLGGDYETFIALMNQRAKEIGCRNTQFHNPNGLPDEEHWVTAYDMALISAEAYKNETFRIIAGTKSYTIPPTNKHEDPTYCQNHHKMIYPWQGDRRYLWDNCTGGKTGYTVAAGNTLVSYAQKDGLTLVCVVMNARSPFHYTDSRELLDYCFDNFQALNISANERSMINEKTNGIGVIDDYESFVALDKEAYIVLPKTVEFEEAKSKLMESQEDGSTLAKLSYRYANREVGSANIVTTGAKVKENYFQGSAPSEEEEGPVLIIKPYMVLLVAGGIALVALVVFLFIRLYQNFYVIKHNMEVKKERKSRFRIRKNKRRYRRRDRMFK